MEQYIGTKRIQAKPMNRKEYNDYRGWELPSDEDGNDEGYLVEYLDGGKSNHPNHAGYISWSPKDVFEKAYRKINGLTFGDAMEALKAGKMVARGVWVYGAFIFMQVPFVIPNPITQQMQSLPESVKAEFAKRGEDVSYSNQIAFVSHENKISGWAPSPADTLAEDWIILD